MATNTIVVVHGKSELAIVRRLGKILRMPIETVCRNNAEESITIAQLAESLSTGQFASENNLHRTYQSLGYKPRGESKMPDLRIFTIMDVDMDFRSFKSYVSGELFRGSPFYRRIVPIYNNPNMDVVMESIGYGRVVDKKMRSYSRIIDEIRDPLDLYSRFESCENTNMEIFVRHCLSCSPPYQSRLPPNIGLN